MSNATASESNASTDIYLSPRQTRALEYLQDPKIDVLLYGGAKGGGKSVFGCYWVYLTSIAIIKAFNLKPTQYHVPIGFMGRKQGVDFNDTTLETWKAYIPEQSYTIKSGDKEIIIEDRVKIQYGGFDDMNTVRKFNSAEYVFAFVDQAEEITRDDYGLLRGTLRRKVNGAELDYKVLLTANPAVCWLKDEFITSISPGCAFLQALPYDNPFLPDTYINNLKEAFKHRPELLSAYLEGSWDVMAGADLVIKPSWVEKSVNRDIPIEEGKCVVSCDPARFGDDETVIYVFKDERVVEQMIYGQRSTMETAGYLSAFRKKHDAKLIAVDVVGIGAGIVDRLRELGEKVLEVNGGEKATDELKEKRFCNRNAQMWWEGAEKFANELVAVPDDMMLRRQLVNRQYKMRSDRKVEIESKAKVKERMANQSPDRADAFIIGLHALDYVPVARGDFMRRQPVRKHRDGYGWRTQPNPFLGGHNGI